MCADMPPTLPTLPIHKLPTLAPLATKLAFNVLVPRVSPTPNSDVLAYACACGGSGMPSAAAAAAAASDDRFFSDIFDNQSIVVKLLSSIAGFSLGGDSLIALR